MTGRYMVLDDIVAQRLGDEVVLVHPGTDRIFLLNLTAARVWELLSQRCERDEIEERLLEEFTGDPVAVRQGFEATIARLLQEGFIRPGAA